jgi:hypothetical protein
MQSPNCLRSGLDDLSAVLESQLAGGELLIQFGTDRGFEMFEVERVSHS